MKGKLNVIAVLNSALKDELTAVAQYTLAGEALKAMGLGKLGEEMVKEGAEELGHARMLMERILFLEGVATPEIGKVDGSMYVEGILNATEKAEQGAVKRYCELAKVGEEEGDFGSHSLALEILRDEEKHLNHVEGLKIAYKEAGKAAFVGEMIS